MEINSSLRPVANDSAAVANASLQNERFKERRQREAQSDVKNEAVFFSPVIRIDKETQSAVIQYRDTTTGEVKNEYPNKKAASNYERADGTASEKSAKNDVKVVSASNDDVAEEPTPSVDEDA